MSRVARNHSVLSVVEILVSNQVVFVQSFLHISHVSISLHHLLLEVDLTVKDFFVHEFLVFHVTPDLSVVLSEVLHLLSELVVLLSHEFLLHLLQFFFVIDLLSDVVIGLVKSRLSQVNCRSVLVLQRPQVALLVQISLVGILGWNGPSHGIQVNVLLHSFSLIELDKLVPVVLLPRQHSLSIHI